ncbi:putative transcriptional regulator [Janibacter sp. HTCC2649]|uniref:TetR/AcrR family transcriptional regulator n=1 Tax=Janibacter sp. HTCC2649 TaxID=313589 RepID=UPI00006709F3|nr:TetR/AcrR family transcriptional regulator [Janibacter sp. HTCC2649]EAQ00089.1 putative transcriptional regulator [Janibacter sp. HTCC2649]
MSSPDGQDCRGLRADAESNRRRIIAAAQQVFGERGVSAPLTEVADRAGVGIATLYRRFPTRKALVEEAFEDAFAGYDASADMALAEEDPWEAFAGLVERMGALQAENRGFTHLIQSSVPLGHRRDGRRERTYRKTVEVIDRARAAGAIRDDVTPEDLPVLSFALAGILEVTRDDLPDAWRRHVAYFLAGCRPEAPATLPPAPAPLHLQRAMLRSGRRRQQR